MIIDSSVLIAILEEEADADALSAAIGSEDARSTSAGTLLEAGMVAERREGGATRLDRLIANFRIEIVPFTASQAALAREAFRRFGKGRHSARLNFGDCMAYALAQERGEPLLFKGDDFSKTDVEAAVY